MTSWSTDDEGALAAAADELRAGRPVVIPTDTVYGLAALASDPDAVETIFAWKDRPTRQTMAVLVASAAQAWTLGLPTPAAVALADAFWPGPLTLVLDQVGERPLAIGAPSATVGVRWPAADFVECLAERVGPLTTTSANRHGHDTPHTARAVTEHLGQPDVCVIDGGVIAGEPSTVVDARGSDPRVLRIGPISASEVRAAVTR